MKTINLEELDKLIKEASRFEQVESIYTEVRMTYERRKDEIVLPESFLKASDKLKKFILITLIFELGHFWAKFIREECYGTPEEILFYYYINYYFHLANFLGIDYEALESVELKDFELNEELINGFKEIMNDIARLNIERYEELLLMLVKMTEQIKVSIKLIYEWIDRIINNLIESKLEGKPVEMGELVGMFLDGFSLDFNSLLLYKVILQKYDDLILKPHFASKNPKS